MFFLSLWQFHSSVDHQACGLSRLRTTVSGYLMYVGCNQSRSRTLRSVTTGDWSLVGRVAELEFVASRLVKRSNGGVMLAGDLGVGKTRLAKEALSRIPRD